MPVFAYTNRGRSHCFRISESLLYNLIRKWVRLHNFDICEEDLPLEHTWDKLQLVLLHYFIDAASQNYNPISSFPIELFYYQSQCKLKPCALSDQISFVSQQRYFWVLKTVQGGVQDRIRVLCVKGEINSTLSSNQDFYTTTQCVQC